MTLTRAIVKYVDETQLIARVVQYANESPEFIATLQAISESTFVLIPKINSVVVIGYINNSPNQAVILQYSEIDKIIFNTHSKCTITCNQSKFEVYPDYITLQSQNGNIMIADGVTIGEGSEPMVLGNVITTMGSKRGYGFVCHYCLGSRSYSSTFRSCPSSME